MFDVVVIGGGPCGSTAAEDLCWAGHLVALLDRENFDEFLRGREVEAGAERFTGTYVRVEGDVDGIHVIYRDKSSGEEKRLTSRLFVGADGAHSNVARDEVPGGSKILYDIANHEIVEAPAANANFDLLRCDVIYDGVISPNFYGWVFLHGKRASIGMGTGIDGVDLKATAALLGKSAGLEGCNTIRREGAPIPLRPLARWDNGRDVVLAGDAAGVVAPSPGEAIFYAMFGGRVAATAVGAFLKSGKIENLKLARKLFMKDHKNVFNMLSAMQNAYYKSDE